MVCYEACYGITVTEQSEQLLYINQDKKWKILTAKSEMVSCREFSLTISIALWAVKTHRKAVF